MLEKKNFIFDALYYQYIEFSIRLYIENQILRVLLILINLKTSLIKFFNASKQSKAFCICRSRAAFKGCVKSKTLKFF